MFAPLLALVLAADPVAPTSLYDIPVQTIDGKTTTLAQYKGKALVIVNTASKCGYTPQYKGLQALYEQYKERGLVVLGFPTNNFAGQEPGSNEEIKKFCELNYKVTFPMFAKISVKGDDLHPLYKLLTSDAEHGGAVSWNFNKFLVSADGKILEHAHSKTEPMSIEFKGRVEAALAQGAAPSPKQ